MYVVFGVGIVINCLITINKFIRDMMSPIPSLAPFSVTVAQKKTAAAK